MGNAPITPLKSETKTEIPISETKETAKKGAYPSTIIIGVLLSVIVGVIILVYRHYKNKKPKSDDSLNTGKNRETHANTSEVKDEDAHPKESEQTQINPDTEQHEEIEKRFN